MEFSLPDTGVSAEGSDFVLVLELLSSILESAEILPAFCPELETDTDCFAPDVEPEEDESASVEELVMFSLDGTELPLSALGYVAVTLRISSS